MYQTAILNCKNDWRKEKLEKTFFRDFDSVSIRSVTCSSIRSSEDCDIVYKVGPNPVLNRVIITSINGLIDGCLG